MFLSLPARCCLLLGLLAPLGLLALRFAALALLAWPPCLKAPKVEFWRGSRSPKAPKVEFWRGSRRPKAPKVEFWRGSSDRGLSIWGGWPPSQVLGYLVFKRHCQPLPLLRVVKRAGLAPPPRRRRRLAAAGRGLEMPTPWRNRRALFTDDSERAQSL